MRIYLPYDQKLTDIPFCEDIVLSLTSELLAYYIMLQQRYQET